MFLDVLKTGSSIRDDLVDSDRFAPSSASERSRMLDLQHGTHYQPTFVPNLVKLISRNCSKLTYLALLIFIDFCFYFLHHVFNFFIYVMRLCSSSNERTRNVLT